MHRRRYSVKFSDGVPEALDKFSARSTKAKLQVGSILQKAEMFDQFGTETCNTTSDIRCVGQHEVLPISNGCLCAFVELRNQRTESEILFVEEVYGFGDMRRAWERVLAIFGYEPNTFDPDTSGGCAGRRYFYL